MFIEGTSVHFDGTKVAMKTIVKFISLSLHLYVSLLYRDKSFYAKQHLTVALGSVDCFIQCILLKKLR